MADMRDRLIELIERATCKNHFSNLATKDIEFSIKTCEECKYYNSKDCETERTADYLIENGVILPPCKTENKLIKLVGSTVYSYNDDFDVVLPYFVENLNIGYYDEHKNCYNYEANCTNEEENELIDSIDFGLDDIGKTVFLTKEEAQKALEERIK